MSLTPPGMARAAGALALLLLAGCCTAAQAGRDLKELGHVNFAVGLGARASVQLGDLVHAGAGAEVALRAGYAYGNTELWLIGEKVNLVVYHSERAVGHGENIETCWQTPPCRLCVAILPVLTNRKIRTWVHRFDIDIEVMLGVIGFGLGFSPGELVEFIATLFGADFDPEPWGGATEWSSGVPSPLWPPKPEPLPPEDDPRN